MEPELFNLGNGFMVFIFSSHFNTGIYVHINMILSIEDNIFNIITWLLKLRYANSNFEYLKIYFLLITFLRVVFLQLLLFKHSYFLCTFYLIIYQHLLIYLSKRLID